MGIASWQHTEFGGLGHGFDPHRIHSRGGVRSFKCD